MRGSVNSDRFLGGWPMVESIAPLVLLIVGAFVGVLVGVVHASAERTCPCCGLHSSWPASRCPHCRCYLA